MARKIPRVWVNVQTGELTVEALRYLDDLENGGSGEANLGTLLSGLNTVTATTTGIVNGTQPLTDVLITGVGSVTDTLEAQTGNVNAASTAASAGALTATLSSLSATGSRVGPGTVTTNTVTVTPAGGTGPYMYAWAYVSGDTVTVNSPTAATTDFDVLLTTPAPTKTGQYSCTVTDSLSATYAVFVNVSGFST